MADDKSAPLCTAANVLLHDRHAGACASQEKPVRKPFAVEPTACRKLWYGKHAGAASGYVVLQRNEQWCT